MTSPLIRAALAACAALLPFTALAQYRSPPSVPPEAQIFDPLSLKANVGGPVSDVLVLGSPHLAQMDPLPADSSLELLLDRLEAFQPGLIAVEAVSGPDCETLERHDAMSPGVAADYCNSRAAARAATGLDAAAASVAASAMLAEWAMRPPSEAVPTSADRRRLAALFLAAGDFSSAAVQWLHMPPDDRRAGDGIDTDLAGTINAVIARPNERIDVAARLAVRLGLQRLYAIDDHSADSIQAGFGPAGQAAVQAVWNRQNALSAEYRRQSAAATTVSSMLNLYRWLNLPATQRGVIAIDHAANMAEAVPPYYGRRYGMWWEARNLRMVANLRVAMADLPGARVLVVVGASHKPHMDAYLNLMHDITIVDAAAILR